MKTYLLDTFSRFKRYSEKLDAQTVLCNKCWLVFNDAGEKETYIFKEDGSIIISLSGAVTYGKWEYIPVNKSVIISGNSQSFMVIPSFLDECILALQVDGTNNFAFLIDEQNKSSFAPKTYQDVVGYFETKERKVIEAEKEAERIRFEELELKAKKELAEKEEAERKALEEKLKKNEEKLRQNAIDVIENFSVHFTIVWIFASVLFLVTISTLKENNMFGSYIQSVSNGKILAITFIIFVLVGVILFLKIRKWYLNRYITNHADDPVIQYLEEYL